MKIRWMWNNPEECSECGRDLVTQGEIEKGICDDCNIRDAWDEYSRCGVSPGEDE